jgi:periplasmic protein TonB
LVDVLLEATFKNVLSKNASSSESLIFWAVICSILLHGLLLVTLPNFTFEPSKKTEILTVEIQQPEPPKPVAVPEPAPVIDPPKPEPIKKMVEPKPTQKPITKTVEAPTPIEQTESADPVVDRTPPPNVIAVAPSENTKPVAVVSPPTPEPPKTVEPSQADVDSALDEYGSLLGRSIAKHKQYPKIAQMRGWQGDVKLDLKLDGNGKVLSASVLESSGFDALDKQALEMVRKASPFPVPPAALRNRTFNINVPVSFKLE